MRERLKNYPNRTTGLVMLRKFTGSDNFSSIEGRLGAMGQCKIQLKTVNYFLAVMKDADTRELIKKIFLLNQ